MPSSPLRSLFGRPTRRPCRQAASLRLLALESRDTPSTLMVDPSFTSDPAHHRFSTIQAAVDAAKPGDNIQVSPGTYNEAVTITKSDMDLFAVGKPGSVRDLRRPTGADIAVHVDGGAKDVDIVGFTITGANAGIQFGDHFDSPASASGSGSAIGDTVFGYDQVGIEVIGDRVAGHTVPATSCGARARPARPTPRSASRSATAPGQRCSARCRFQQCRQQSNEGVGILVFQTSNVEVEHNVVFGNDEGILLAAFPGGHPRHQHRGRGQPVVQ